MLSSLSSVSSPAAFGAQEWEGPLGDWTHHLWAAEGWAIPKPQCTYRSVIRMQALRPCPGGSGSGAPGGSAIPGPSLVPGDSLLEGNISVVGSGKVLYQKPWVCFQMLLVQECADAGACWLVWNQPRWEHLHQSNRQTHQPRLFNFFFLQRASLPAHSITSPALGDLEGGGHGKPLWMSLSFHLNGDNYISPLMGLWGNKCVHEKASHPGLGSINLQFILLLQKFPIIFSLWEHTRGRMKWNEHSSWDNSNLHVGN